MNDKFSMLFVLQIPLAFSTFVHDVGKIEWNTESERD